MTPDGIVDQGVDLGYSDELRRKAAPIWQMEQRHPFVTGIGDGTLPLENFQYYMRQDFIFLVGFCRAIALAAAKATGLEEMSWFARLLHETLNTEMALHVSFCADFGISEQELRATEASPTTLAYTNHLVHTAYSGGTGEIAAVILPCSWGYCEIGQTLASRGAPSPQPLYARWIEMYASDEFAELAAWLRSYVDRTALESSPDELARMERAFLRGSQLEYMFWDAAYRLEEWPV